MDAATLQARINAGYGRAALRLGYPFTAYRPKTATAAIAAANALSGPAINASFKPGAGGFNYLKAGSYKDAVWLGLFDPTQNRVGDYLYNASHGTYFIAALQDTLPTLCVRCNNTLSVLRAAGSPVLGIGGYSGATAANEAPLITAWPSNLLLEARGRNTGANLPMDEQNPYFVALLPAFGGVDIRPSDIVTDGNVPARRYIVAAAERSGFGWRMLLQHAVS